MPNTHDFSAEEMELILRALSAFEHEYPLEWERVHNLRRKLDPDFEA